ncbi:thioredoxin family protein [Roseovarius rhodophyticola]|uniref:Thioredoxin family protein n=1 Tax=Roseovarius rhodophyticola TaxID=3080827 RepID=A0ABZ2TJ58_9RHOB|nr:thioredoxin family protein [Roseovarius sp. W115]MDV2929434.1 thioredoxin family protein [Roseovarius sp. W115]
MTRWVVLLFCLLFGALPSAADETKPTLDIFPQVISKSCFGGRAESYDECGDQTRHLADAKARAEETGKTVLVMLGAEWCIWCHVLKNYLKGESGFFEYTLEGESGYNMNEFATQEDKAQAAALARFAAENFVIAAIEHKYATGADRVLVKTGAGGELINWIPFVYALDARGQMTGRLPTFQERPEMEHRREGVLWYRGYDRAVLLEELKHLLDQAQK